MKMKLLLATLALFTLVQFIPVDKSSPDKTEPLVAPDDVKQIFERSCYDCHSSKTEWPWYSNVAPVSWWVVEHTKNAKRHLNFERWGDYSQKESSKLKNEILEEIESKGMPLPAYTLLHKDTVLSKKEIETVKAWCDSADQVASEPTDTMIGKPAPTPVAKDQDRESVDLGAAYNEGPVLIFFYPRAGSPGCTLQASSLRDSYESLRKFGLTIYGVSTDGSAKQKSFKSDLKLPFTLLADPDGEILRAFGVLEFFGMAQREAFLIKDGLVVWHDAEASTYKQSADILAVLGTWK